MNYLYSHWKQEKSRKSQSRTEADFCAFRECQSESLALFSESFQCATVSVRHSSAHDAMALMQMSRTL